MKRATELVVVTGAGSGIGRATTLRFARGGAVVIAADIDLEAAEQTAKLVADAGGTAHPYRVDVSDEQAMERFATEVHDHHGVADVVVNNAGFTTAGAFFDHSAAEWDRLMGVNVYGVIQGSRLFAKQMVLRGEGGQIINVASAAAFTPIPLSTPYCTTKAAVRMASECLRIELARDKIGVTAVCPGMIDTGFYRAADHLKTAEHGYGDEVKQATIDIAGRFGHSPDVVAAAIVRAVRTNPPIMLVTAEAKFGYLMSRVSPGLLRLGARHAVVDKIAALTGRTKRRTVVAGK
ncbi:SDR family NAD(P)-dependent oxidoreductase [Nocardia uniformis]|uniref:SDR family NAD(P)-dependent oxidoreductase n=1 Tax=Nocardia uniformis TaxID=53432 RepID=A0A849BXC3_9NOCA|nr:SDR family NAD(P)-dependent oxidoreductase [Nocardia uniformis]NNH70924.1 SDR family NAD(P)-dependent oxidoreductase [Nocardia uniformis]